MSTPTMTPGAGAGAGADPGTTTETKPRQRKLSEIPGVELEVVRPSSPRPALITLGLTGGHADLQLAGNGPQGTHGFFPRSQHAVQGITRADFLPDRVERQGNRFRT